MGLLLVLHSPTHSEQYNAAVATHRVVTGTVLSIYNFLKKKRGQDGGKVVLEPCFMTELVCCWHYDYIEALNNAHVEATTSRLRYARYPFRLMRHEQCHTLLSKKMQNTASYILNRIPPIHRIRISDFNKVHVTRRECIRRKCTKTRSWAR